MKAKVKTIPGKQMTADGLVLALSKLVDSPIQNREEFDLLVYLLAVVRYLQIECPATFSFAVKNANECMAAAELYYLNQFKKGGAK